MAAAQNVFQGPLRVSQRCHAGQPDSCISVQPISMRASFFLVPAISPYRHSDLDS
jgi:hypothetical protein